MCKSSFLVFRLGYTTCYKNDVSSEVVKDYKDPFYNITECLPGMGLTKKVNRIQSLRGILSVEIVNPGFLNPDCSASLKLKFYYEILLLNKKQIGNL